MAIAAPGGDKSQGEEAGVLQQTIDPDGNPAYLWFQGTSMATPHVAGAAALVMSLGVTSPGAVERLLTSTAKSAGDSEKYGAGLLDVAAAVRTETVWWALFRIAFAAVGAWFALKHARKIGQLRPNEKPGALLWAGLGLGAGVVVLPLHHPIRVAEQALMVDCLSNGRLLLGIGRGYQPPEFAGFGQRLAH